MELREAINYRTKREQPELSDFEKLGGRENQGDRPWLSIHCGNFDFHILVTSIHVFPKDREYFRFAVVARTRVPALPQAFWSMPAGRFH